MAIIDPAACERLFNEHFPNSPESAADFARDMQRWARWFADQREDEAQQRNLHGQLKNLASLSADAKTALGRLIAHPAFGANNRLHVLWDHGSKLDRLRQIADAAIPLLSQLGAAAASCLGEGDLAPERGAPRKEAKYTATFDLITIFEWYAKTPAKRINDKEVAYGAFRDFVIAAFAAVGVKNGPAGQLQEALRDHPHDFLKPFSRR